MPDHNRVIQVAVPRPLHSVYDYAVPENIPVPPPGTRVEVPFGRSRTLGICVNTEVSDPHKSLKPIHAWIDAQNAEPAVSAELLQLAQWMSSYYHHPLGEVLATVLPAAARRGVEFAITPADLWQVIAPHYANSRAPRQQQLMEFLTAHPGSSGAAIQAAGFSRALLNKLAELSVIARCDDSIKPDTTEPPLPPTAEQATAIQSVMEALGHYKTLLLEGVTGSGKTEVYLQSIAAVVADGGQALVLVPEIALTPQTLARFQRRFARTGMLHSALTDNERLQTWLKCRSGDFDIVLGTRSAIFTSFRNLKLIIVDEEHDSSYKQQDGLRYSARDLGAKRAQGLSIPLLLGSATPSLESLYNAKLQRYQHLRLMTRAGGAQMPDFNVIDMRNENVLHGLSHQLITVIRKHLAAAGQVLIYLNRRGFAPTVLCQRCGWQSHCSDCDAKLTLHQTPPQMICHHCSLKFQIPKSCEHCGHTALLPIGLGTQRAEENAKQLFADTPVYRIDRDTTRSNRQLNEQLQQINRGDPCVLVGTQMLAKGHHFPNVTLVAVVNADAGLLSPDFRAPERTAQLIVQVAGRAGRAERPGEVWIQSYQPENPLLTTLIGAGYGGFAETELASRQLAQLPPITPMALLRAESEDAELAQQFLQQCKAQCQSLGLLQQIEVMGPVPAPLGRLANRHRFQLMLIGQDRRSLHRCLSALDRSKAPSKLRWSIDVDPYDAM
jgi:primosomal protein N' (replication factor Y)